jgi:hypothetical protein
MVDVRNTGNVWRAFYAGDVGLGSLYIPLSTEVEKDALRKYAWQFEPGIAESWVCASARNVRWDIIINAHSA